MTRRVYYLANPDVRNRVIQQIREARDNTRVELKDPKRTTPQNSIFWAMLTDIAEQTDHNGRRYTPDQWKVLFLHACGREVQFLPALDGSTFIPWGQSSSDLSKQEMTDLIEFMFAWGAENGIRFHGDDPTRGLV